MKRTLRHIANCPCQGCAPMTRYHVMRYQQAVRRRESMKHLTMSLSESLRRERKHRIELQALLSQADRKLVAVWLSMAGVAFVTVALVLCVH
jgi:hypothetical protein